MSDFYDYVTQPSNQRNNLIDALILFQNLMKQFNQTWFENIKIKELKYERVILIVENSQDY